MQTIKDRLKTAAAISKLAEVALAEIERLEYDSRYLLDKVSRLEATNAELVEALHEDDV